MSLLSKIKSVGRAIDPSKPIKQVGRYIDKTVTQPVLSTKLGRVITLGNPIGLAVTGYAKLVADTGLLGKTAKTKADATFKVAVASEVEALQIGSKGPAGAAQAVANMAVVDITHQPAVPYADGQGGSSAQSGVYGMAPTTVTNPAALSPAIVLLFGAALLFIVLAPSGRKD